MSVVIPLNMYVWCLNTSLVARESRSLFSSSNRSMLGLLGSHMLLLGLMFLSLGSGVFWFSFFGHLPLPVSLGCDPHWEQVEHIVLQLLVLVHAARQVDLDLIPFDALYLDTGLPDKPGNCLTGSHLV